MTAIAGLIQFCPQGGEPQPVDRAALARMQQALAMYGRDAQHSRVDGSTGWVRTLLRTTPEDSFDQQPLHHLPSRTTVLFDGRLDNRDELARALSIDTARLAAMADSEVALHACLAWGIDTPQRLLGDWAIACWQAGERRLWLARDPMGGRPLFFHQGARHLAFATMPKGLFAVPGVPRESDELRIHDYLCLLPMVGTPWFFKDIHRVLPGHALLWQGGQVKRHSAFHAFDRQAELRLPRDEDYVHALREHLDRAVACRLRSSGRIASHLSSGYDSSTVTATAARQMAALGRADKLLAYTAVPRPGYDDSARQGRHGDEGPGARALAARFANIEHRCLSTGGISPLKHLHTAVERLDRPPLNPCNQVWASEIEHDAVARGAKVLLTGAMGNMSISYTGEQMLGALVGQGHWLRWWRERRALQRVQGGRYWAVSFGPHVPPWLWRLLKRLAGQQPHRLTNYTATHPAFMARLDTAARERATGWDVSYRPWADGRAMRLAVLSRLDNGDYNAAANAAGLDMRDPTVDRRLFEFCLAVPDEQYLRHGQTRWLLHRLMDPVLPPEITQARTKGKQAVDWHEGAQADLQGLRDEWARQQQHGGVGERLDLPALERLLTEWPQAGWHRDGQEEAYRLKLLRGLSVGAFIRFADERNA